MSKLKTVLAIASATVITGIGVGGALHSQTGTDGSPDSTSEVSENSSSISNVSQGEEKRSDPTLVNLKSELEKNRDEVAGQIETERARAEKDLQLPAGAEFGPIHALTELDDQIEEVSEAQTSGTALPENLTPAAHWYEDGYFESLMVIDWKCAWLSTGGVGVEEGDSATTEQAVKTLQGLSHTKYVDAFPDYDYFLKHQVDPLLHGDTAGALEYLPSCMPSTRVDEGSNA